MATLNKEKNVNLTAFKIANAQRHNEREKDSYTDPDSCRSAYLTIGNTWYVVETECDGNEPLANKVKRLIFSDKGVICE